jgi:hypothetical protein
MKINLGWKDAIKERPQEGQVVLVASLNPSRPTYIRFNICEYKDGRFWNVPDFSGREPETNVLTIDCKLRYEVQNAKAWSCAKAIFNDDGKFFIDPSPSEEANQ